MADFNWHVEVGSSGEVMHARTVVQYGDGYSMAAANGINSKAAKWEIMTRGKESELQAVVDFLDGKAGVQSFTWRPPFGNADIRVRAEPYKIDSLGAGYFVLSTTFQQVFHP